MRLMSLCVTAEQRPEQRAENGVFQSSTHIPLMGAAVLTVQFCHKTLPGEPVGFCVVELGSGRGIPEPHSVLNLSHPSHLQTSIDCSRFR